MNVSPEVVASAAEVLLRAAMDYQVRDLDREEPPDDAYFEAQARAQIEALLEAGWMPPVVSTSTKQLEGAIFDVLAGHCTDSEDAVRAVIECGWRPAVPRMVDPPDRWADGDALDTAIERAQVQGDRCEVTRLYVPVDQVRGLLAALLPNYSLTREEGQDA